MDEDITVRTRIDRCKTCLAALSLTIIAGVAGCSKDAQDNKGPDKPIAELPATKDNDGKPIKAQTVSRANAPKLPSFKEAVVLAPAPEGELQPPDRTCTGKSTAKIFETIAHDLWDRSTFTSPEGKPLKYRAIMKTDLGDIHFDLYGDIAPNHVRSFVCLARAGYYDGMPFYYTLNREVQGTRVAYIESGCPKGTGEDGHGSIGYWLRPEISEKITHEEGVLGACLRQSPDSAACRFYITAAALPQMDGNFTAFGKVTKGLDIVRTINTRAVDEFDRPKMPVVIRSVTVLSVTE